MTAPDGARITQPQSHSLTHSLGAMRKAAQEAKPRTNSYQRRLDVSSLTEAPDHAGPLPPPKEAQDTVAGRARMECLCFPHQGLHCPHPPYSASGCLPSRPHNPHGSCASSFSPQYVNMSSCFIFQNHFLAAINKMGVRRELSTKYPINSFIKFRVQTVQASNSLPRGSPELCMRDTNNWRAPQPSRDAINSFTLLETGRPRGCLARGSKVGCRPSRSRCPSLR